MRPSFCQHLSAFGRPAEPRVAPSFVARHLNRGKTTLRFDLLLALQLPQARALLQ
jgi:hypothetical protein